MTSFMGGPGARDEAAKKLAELRWETVKAFQRWRAKGKQTRWLALPQLVRQWKEQSSLRELVHRDKDLLEFWNGSESMAEPEKKRDSSRGTSLAPCPHRYAPPADQH